MADYLVSGSSVATVTLVTAPASTTVLAAANGKRRGLLIFNNTDKDLYVKLGATVSLTDYTVVFGSKIVYEVPRDYYTGNVAGLSAAGATGKVSVTEIVDATIPSDTILPS